ncbi:porin [Cupriavidus metallidurans]|uniref:porin n=1 Tax=Cupriavidus TaxID=106589 RepID=UPI0002A4396B|nr:MULTISPECIES: porin [Cupriavidus]EKZ95369.1 outer membrane protein [Cupriavidus sp. HMR-1]GMG95107.1 porin [Cupriavidus sp. TKC]HBD37607.1 porin [Cupriavidus sp.]
MKKSLVVLAALSAMTSAAHAQSSVTLYGVIDLGVEYINRVATAPTSASQTLAGVPPAGSRVDMPGTGGLSASRWGLRGSEDLGGGLKAIFTLESQFSPDTGAFAGNTGIFNRQAYLGLSNQYGKVTFGKQYSSLAEGMLNFSPTRAAPAYEPGVWWLGINYRPANTVKYTGNFGPVSAAAHYSFGTGVGLTSLSPSGILYGSGLGETPGAPRDNTAWGGSLVYLDERFGLGVGYDQWNPAGSIGVTGKVRKAAIAGSYANGPMKVMAGYRWGDQTYANGNTAMRDDYWFAGVSYRINAALDLQLAYFYTNIKQLALSNSSVPTNPANPQQVSFVADYALSKRTDIYFTTAWVHNGALANDGPFTGYLFNYPQAPGQKNMVGVMSGIRHIF